MRRGRFAPSPSGALHLGSARTAVAAYLATRVDGDFILRIEDLDTARAIQGATQSIIADLRWLGLNWNEGPDRAGRFGPYEQSARRKLYDDALALLDQRGSVYPCSCSRREIEMAAQAPHGVEPIYPGFCREKPRDLVIQEAHSRGREVAWRFRVQPEVVSFVDQVHGAIHQDVEHEVGDFVVFRADAVPAYQLAVVVDDIAMKITDVVRGDDLLASTPRQILLYRALGGTEPTWLHVPLVVGEDGVRLAKRHGAISLAELRARGVEPERLQRALLESLGIEADWSDAVLDATAVPREAISIAKLRRMLPEIG